MVLKVVAERKAEAEALYREVADAYLDLMNQIASLKPSDAPDVPVNIEAEELENNRLVLRRFDMPDLIIDMDQPLPA